VEHRLVATETDGVVICDVDNLKQINDADGRSDPPRVPPRPEPLRPRRARLGGDEFVV
jgi:hypothetical protein